MLKDHPRGLFVLAIANMGERFGYYTMLAVFTLYLQAKFGYSSSYTGEIFGNFLGAVYFLPLLGGIIADKFLGYGKTILLGIFIMFLGYLLLAVPIENLDTGFWMMVGALGLISFGTGFFKGNLQALVGNLYDNPLYKAKRDMAFMLFYMCINIGAFFAPSAADFVNSKFMKMDGFAYSAQVTGWAMQYNNFKVLPDSTSFKKKIFSEAKGEKIKDSAQYLTKAKNSISVFFKHDSIKIAKKLELAARTKTAGTDISIKEFSHGYIRSLTKSYNYAFGVACLSLIISILVFIFFRKYYQIADITETQKKQKKMTDQIVELSPEESKKRIFALGLVFTVVIFFWMSFHQNGLTLTFFARDYTVGKVSSFTGLWFSLAALVPFALGFYGLFYFFQNQKEKSKWIGLAVAVAAVLIIGVYYSLQEGSRAITPQIFQQFNPFFIIILTPVSIALFDWLGRTEREPSSPRKIGYGMIIAGLGFATLIVVSLGLKAPSEINGVSDVLVSPYWLINCYFILTLAELLLSPIGISFVSKVAPPKYKGLMQGAWFAATAVGNKLVGVTGGFWDKVPLWAFWSILVVCCAISAIFIFSIIKRLEAATK